MKRLQSIDILRGMALFGMLLVNNPGSWSHIYSPLEHAEFIGLTPTDLVFPTFLFVMGFCIPLSLQKYDFRPSWTVIRKILLRTLIIFGVGLFLQWMSSGWCVWHDLRIPGVLQRLALCYCVGALLTLCFRSTAITSIATGILVIYNFILDLGHGFELSEDNICARVDQFLLGPSHMYVDQGIHLDPEGILSTLPAVSHVLYAVFFSLSYLQLHRTSGNTVQQQEVILTFIKSTSYFIFATIAFTVIDLVADFPISKKVWSPTFVLVTISIALLLLDALMWLVDVKRLDGRWSQFFVIFGRNPLLLYIISWIMADLFDTLGITWGIYSTLSTYVAPELASLLYALLFVLFHWCIAYVLYKCKVRINA